MHKFLKFISGTKLHMFRTVPLSIIRSFLLYTQQTCMTYTTMLAENKTVTYKSVHPDLMWLKHVTV